MCACLQVHAAGEQWAEGRQPSVGSGQTASGMGSTTAPCQPLQPAGLAHQMPGTDWSTGGFTNHSVSPLGGTWRGGGSGACVGEGHGSLALQGVDANASSIVISQCRVHHTDRPPHPPPSLVCDVGLHLGKCPPTPPSNATHPPTHPTLSPTLSAMCASTSAGASGRVAHKLMCSTPGSRK